MSILKVQRRELTRISEQGVKNTQIGGRILLEGTGEAITPVRFSCWFSEMPIFTYGSAYEFGFVPEYGSFAYAVGCVSRWEVERASEGFPGYYVAADLAITAFGTETQQLWFHWSMQGKALSNPSIGEPVVEEPT